MARSSHHYYYHYWTSTAGARAARQAANTVLARQIQAVHAADTTRGARRHRYTDFVDTSHNAATSTADLPSANS